MALAAVRAAAPPDVAEIVRIQADTWSAAYAELVPAAAIDRLRGDAASGAWTAAVDAATDGTGGPAHVIVATEGDRTVGFCAAAAVAPSGAPDAAGPDTAGPDTDGPDTDGPDTDAPTLGPDAWGEIGVLLVEPRWGRRGHGGRLLAAAADALRAAGAIYGLAWIPEPDEASRRFYARAGWEPDGTVRGLDTGDGTLREIRVTGSLDLMLQE